MRTRITSILAVLMLLAALYVPLGAQAQEAPKMELPRFIMKGLKANITLTDPALLDVARDTAIVHYAGKDTAVILEHGVVTLPYNFPEKENVEIIYQGNTLSKPVNPIPLWLSILPPLIAILMAFLTKEVYSSLFTGTLVGAAFIAYYQGAGALAALFVGILDIFDTYIIETISDWGHTSVIVFLMLIGSTVALVSINGGMRGLVRWLSKYAKSPRSGQLINFLMDLCIFFDDYANTLVVGSTMRPLAKDLRISKEKMSFIVDSTAAPVGALALITTWIGAELSYIGEGLKVIGSDESPYALFIESIPERFYPIFMLCFVLIIAISGRDYGPMWKAECIARSGGDTHDKMEVSNSNDREIEPDENTPLRWYNAVIPIGVLILVTVIGIFVTGYDASVWADAGESFGSKLMTTVGSADSYVALLWASISSTIVGIAITVFQKILSFRKAMNAMLTGFKIMLPATIVLVLAWTLALITKYMHTADFVSGALVAWNVTPLLLPALTFVLAGIIAFSTGTSWGTMAILYPLVIPVVWQLSINAGLDSEGSRTLLLNVISCILSGAVMGDHCSPISDTTIMSSSSTGCHHLAHVSTQMPYALTVSGVSLVFTILATLGVSSWILLPAGIVVMWAIVRFFGKKVVPLEEVER